MNRNLPRLAALSLCLIAGLTACLNTTTPAPGSAADTAASAGAGDKVSAQVTGAGASFVYPLISKWSSDYAKATGNKVNYQSIGSGGGIAQIKAGTVDFGSTDKPLSPEELVQDSLVQFPSTIGGVVPVVNLPGIQAGTLRLTGALLADIYLGKVTTWNDAAITAANPGVVLPADKIHVVRRSDGSGTTFNFTDYLSKVNADWKSKVGTGTAVEWPVGVGAKGNEGVSGNISQAKGSIGYVEYAYAKQNKLAYAALINKAGKIVQPTSEAFQAAASNADWVHAPGYHLILTDQPGEKSWPIVASTFILMHKVPADKAATAEALKFFGVAFDKGGKMAEDLDYVPMPANVIDLIKKTWSADVKAM